MSGGHFYTDPHTVADSYCGQWEDAEIDALFFDLFGAGWDRYRGLTQYGKPRKCEFGRTWADPEYACGLAEALDLYLSGDITEEDYREQVARFKRKWLAKKTPANRVDFYQRQFEDAAMGLMQRLKKELGEA